MRTNAILRLIISAALVLLPLSDVSAQKAKAPMTSEVNSNLPDNSVGSITPAIVRQTLSDMINSYQQYAGVNPQAGATYTIQVSDYGLLVVFSNVTPVAVTLPAASGSFSTFNVTLTSNATAGNVTVTPSAGTIGGTASFTLTPGASVWIVSDGTNWQISQGSGTGVVNIGATNQLAYYPNATAVVSPNASAVISPQGTLTLGNAGSAGGKLVLTSGGTGSTTISPQGAAGSTVLTAPNTSGTFAVTASSPLALNATTGNLTVTGAAGMVLAGASPAFTATPTLGVAGSQNGQISFANSATGTVTISPQSGALGSSILTMPAATDTFGLLAASQAFTNKTYNGVTISPTSGTLNIVSAKTFNVSNSLTLAGTDAKTITFGNSITFNGTDGTTMTFPSASATITRTIASGAKTLNTTAVASATCSAAQTDTATGTLTTDAPAVSFNGDPTAIAGYTPLTTGMLTIVYYPTADTMNFRVCNNTSATITPQAATLNWRVTR